MDFPQNIKSVRLEEPKNVESQNVRDEEGGQAWGVSATDGYDSFARCGMLNST